tara:strand:+ start:480 stop:974 length:495 start_codon:yes stop_codon:yes gene_type:complete
VKIIKPTICKDKSLAEAHEHAKAINEPVFVPMSVFADDRGWSHMNLMKGVLGPEGQINISEVYPGTIKAWHRHKFQTDFWMCPKGHIKVGVFRDDFTAWQIVVGEKNPGIVIIPPTLWHGVSTVGPQSALMIYYVTHSYNVQNPDEERRAFDSVEGFHWGVEHK